MPRISPLPVTASVSASVGVLQRSGALRESEIQKLDSLLGDQDIARFQIAMCDALPVRRVKRVEDLSRKFHGPLQRQRAAQWDTIDELHDEVIGTDIVEMADVRMIERRNRVCFPGESIAETAGANLDCHGTV